MQYKPAVTGLAVGGLEHLLRTVGTARVEFLKEQIPEAIMNDPAVKGAMISDQAWPWAATLLPPATGGYTQWPQEGEVSKEGLRSAACTADRQPRQ
jgi:hypothetical protein